MARFNNSGTRPGSGFSNKKFVGSSLDSKQKNNNDEEEEEEDDDDTNDRVEENDDTEQNENQQPSNQDDNEEDEEENRNKDLHLSNSFGAGKSRNKRNQAYSLNQDDEEEEDNEFDRLICPRNDEDDDDNHRDDNQDNRDNDGNHQDELHRYFSNGDDQTQKPWESNETGEGAISMSDLVSSTQQQMNDIRLEQ